MTGLTDGGDLVIRLTVLPVADPTIFAIDGTGRQDSD